MNKDWIKAIDKVKNSFGYKIIECLCRLDAQQTKNKSKQKT